MDSLELNKAAAAVLVAGIAFVGSGLIGKALISEAPPAKTHIEIATAEPTGAAPAKPEEPIAVLLASADPKEGEKLTHQQGCVNCHSFDKGGKAGVGPNLYGVVGDPHGHMAGYDYSSALKSKQGPWTFDELNEWLTKPSAYAPGTKMAYPGLSDEKKRADIIDYLRLNADKPEPLPPVPAKAANATGGAGPAEPQTANLANTATSSRVPGPGGSGGESIDARLASADPKAGEADTKKVGCIACHTFVEGGPNRVGPNLWNVVGAPHGRLDNFNYSQALKSKQGPWTYEALDEWLTKPMAYAPGTKMTFAGVSDPKERADIIDYLRTLSSDPKPLPKP